MSTMCSTCNGTGYVVGKICTECIGTETLPIRSRKILTEKLSLEKLDGIMNKCNDIKEKVDEIKEVVDGL